MRPIRSEPRVLSNVTESSSWRHSWHFSPYLSELPVGSLCGPAFSWESQLFSGSTTLHASNSNSPQKKPGHDATQTVRNGLFPWKRQGNVGSPSSTPSPGLRPPTPEGSRTAPATPVREHLSGGPDTTQYRRSPGLSKSVRHAKLSNTPLDDQVTSRSDWDIRRWGSLGLYQWHMNPRTEEYYYNTTAKVYCSARHLQN